MEHQIRIDPAFTSLGSFSKRRLVLLAACAWFLAGGLAAPVHATVYKCTGAGGKVVFSDQPCPAGQTTTAAREPAGALVAKPQDANEAARAAARARLRATQTPECADMADRIASFGQTGGATTTNAQMNAVQSRYEQQCAAPMREAIEAENKRKQDESQKRILADAACAEKRRVLNERRAKLTTLSESDQRAFAKVEAEAARDCR